MTTNKIIPCPKFLQIKFTATTKTNLFYGAASIAVLTIIVMLVSNPKAYSSTTLQGLNLFVVAVLPGLLPFMFLTKLLTGLGIIKKLATKCGKITNALFGTPGISGYVMLMSMLSGYPIGAKLIADLTTNGAITTKDANRMLSFCTTSGPIFIIGSVGSTMFGNPMIGVVIYLAHIFGSIMCGIALNLLEKMGGLQVVFVKRKGKQNLKNTLQNTNKHGENTNVQTLNATPERIEKIFSDSMTDTVSSILVVGAYIAIFFLLAQMLMDIGLLSGLAKALDTLLAPLGITGAGTGLAGGLLEVTRGCSILGQSVSIGSICLACFVISFSGLSIIMQSMNFLHTAGITTGRFVAVKIFNAIISALICWPLCLMFGL